MYNRARDLKAVEQNPLNVVNLEEVYKTGVVPATACEVTYNALSIGDVFNRAADDIFGCIRESGMYFPDSSHTDNDD